MLIVDSCPVAQHGRDALGRTASLIDPQNRLVEFRYNGANQITNLITHVSGQTREKHFDYPATNGFSRLTQVTTPMGKLIRYVKQVNSRRTPWPC